MGRNVRTSEPHADVVLVGAGIMSATLAALLVELQPGIRIEVFESLDKLAGESSYAWNNAGTGHAGLCELNYTPERENGSIDISKALKVNEQFEVSKQFWAYLVEKRSFTAPENFINPVPHHSLVMGSDNVAYLRKRYEALRSHPLFAGMQFSDDGWTLRDWLPLVMQMRDRAQPVAATRSELGTDVNFGQLTKSILTNLEKKGLVQIHLKHEVQDVFRDQDGLWSLTARNWETDVIRNIRSKFVFLGAGGGALPLLQKTGIPESRGFGGFPVSGQWLVCTNADIVDQHYAKVYGKPAVGAPPMSMPHLDTRIMNGKRALLFGPYAGFSTRFLKSGSLMDMPRALQLDNLIPMLSAGIHNLGLTGYLIGQVLQSQDQRLRALRDFVPTARAEDWKLEVAGQRVQVIKRDPKKGGVLQFGTEVVTAADGSLAALLGASPGASTAVSIMLDVLKRCFPEQIGTAMWQTKLKQMIPSYGQTLANDAKLIEKVRNWTSSVLELESQFDVQQAQLA